MICELPSDGKINLILRVGEKTDGYHKIESIFWRLPAVERLTLRPSLAHNAVDSLEVDVPLDRCNVADLLTATASLRSQRWHVSVHKTVPPGTGLGAGSGNAAALWRFFRDRGEALPEHLALGGSDAFFLGSSFDGAWVTGRGEELTPLSCSLPLVCCVAFPSWRCSTAQLYAALDRQERERLPGTEDLAVLERLSRGEFVGLLPNDFLSVLPFDPAETFEMMRRQGALAWGLSGSGSALFGLWKRGAEPKGYPLARDLGEGRCGCAGTEN